MMSRLTASTLVIVIVYFKHEAVSQERQNIRNYNILFINRGYMFGKNLASGSLLEQVNTVGGVKFNTGSSEVAFQHNSENEERVLSLEKFIEEIMNRTAQSIRKNFVENLV